jgi:mRNA N6-methyladenine demethylase
VQSKSKPVSETAATVTGDRLARAPLGSDTAEAAAMAAPSSAAGDGVDPMTFVQGYNEEEIAVAEEFLTTWLPYLSAGLCPSCVSSLRARVDSLLPRGNRRPPLWPACRRTLMSLGSLFSLPDAQPAPAAKESPPQQQRLDQIEPSRRESDPAPPQHPPLEPSGWDSDPSPPQPQPQHQPPTEKPKMSWADMAQEDELVTAAEDATAVAADDGEEASEVVRQKVQLTRDQREQMRYMSLVRKKDFVCLERVRGQFVNILEGLELHTGVFSSAEQKRIVECVYDLQERGRRGELGGEFCVPVRINIVC